MTASADFEQLVLRHHGAVCAVAYAVLRDRARSEEVAQEAFLIAWQKLPAMSPPPKLPAWICGIARNLAANAARRRKETEMTSEPIETATPLTTVLDAETEALARSALASLPERDREVLVMYFRGDGSIGDVASDLGISEAAARQRLHRGRERLKSAFTAVEKTVRATRPSPAFAAACVVALAARGGAAHAAPAPPATKAIVVAGLATMAIVIAGWSVVAASRASDAPTATTPNANASARAIDVARAPALRELDRERRAAVRSRIAAAHADAAGSAQSGAGSLQPARRSSLQLERPHTKIYDFGGIVLDDLRPIPAPDPGPLSKATLRYAIHQIQPQLLECYTAATGRLARKDGKIDVVLRLIGDDADTIVDYVRLDGDAHLIGDRELDECMRETFLSLELPPIEDGDVWLVNYPLVIR
jgi:RNA polymerase sigma factor (sigma-70 family)